MQSDAYLSRTHQTAAARHATPHGMPGCASTAQPVDPPARDPPSSERKPLEPRAGLLWAARALTFSTGPRWTRGLDVAVTDEAGLDCAASADRIVREVFAFRREADAGFSSVCGRMRSPSSVPSSKSLVPTFTFTSSPQHTVAGSNSSLLTLGTFGSCFVSPSGNGNTGNGGCTSGIGGMLPGEAPLLHMMSVDQHATSASIAAGEPANRHADGQRSRGGAGVTHTVRGVPVDEATRQCGEAPGRDHAVLGAAPALSVDVRDHPFDVLPTTGAGQAGAHRPRQPIASGDQRATERHLFAVEPDRPEPAQGRHAARTRAALGLQHQKDPRLSWNEADG